MVKGLKGTVEEKMKWISNELRGFSSSLAYLELFISSLVLILLEVLKLLTEKKNKL